MTMAIKAKQLELGDEFTTEADGGAVWFKCVQIDIGRGLRNSTIDVLGEVVSANPDSDYAVGDSEWMDVDPDEEVITR